MLKPGCGWLPPSWLPVDGLRRALRTLSRADGPALADYGSPLGLPALRHLIVRRMADRGIEASPDQVMLTESGTQAIDLLCRLLFEPGDTVLVDDPCYFNFQALLRAHRARIVSVPYTPSGPDIELFAQGTRRAPPAALHHQLRDPQSDRRDAFAGDGPPGAEARRAVRPHHHRGRYLRRFRAQPGAAPGRLRRAGPRHSYRQFLQNPVGIGTLRLRRGPPRLDRKPHRPQDRDVVRRRPAHRRARARRAQRRWLPQAPGRPAHAPGCRHARRRRQVEIARHRTLARAAGRNVPVVPPAGRARCRGDRPGGAGEERRPGAGKRLQPVPVGRELCPVQRVAVDRRPHLRRAGRGARGGEGRRPDVVSCAGRAPPGPCARHIPCSRRHRHACRPGSARARGSTVRRGNAGRG